jgi:hypothetical protein
MLKITCLNTNYELTLLFFIDLLTPSGWWFYWPLLGWEIGIIFHALGVFGVTDFLGPEWEKKKDQGVDEQTRQRIANFGAWSFGRCREWMASGQDN